MLLRLPLPTAALAAGLALCIASDVRAADCPAPCVAGGGPAATDCFVQFSGAGSGTTVTLTCTDGDPSCDTDGVADGTCTFALEACVGTSTSACTGSALDGPPTVTPATDPAGKALATALAGVVAGGCTAPGVRVPLKLSLAGIAPGRARFTVVASAGGKRDRDKVKLTCQASSAVKGFAADVQPIFTARCVAAGCHAGPVGFGGSQSLDQGQAWDQAVNVKATEDPKLFRVKPGNVRQSFMARKILGVGIPKPFGGALMPLGCPGVPPLPSPPNYLGGCLTSAETYTILSWIKTGALNN